MSARSDKKKKRRRMPTTNNNCINHTFPANIHALTFRRASTGSNLYDVTWAEAADNTRFLGFLLWSKLLWWEAASLRGNRRA